MKDEKVFTLANVKDMKLLWKVKLESQPREMHNLFSPLIAGRVTTARGAREVAIVAGISDDLFGIDVASGELLWKKRYESTFAPTDKTVYHTLCLGGQTAVPAIEQVAPGKYTIYAVGWDGRLHQINAADGSDVAPPDKFLPPNGKPYALNVVNGVVYTATAQGCGGIPNALYSYHLATRKASTFIPAGGGMWGRRGAAVSPEGVVYMVTGDANFSPQTKSLGNAIVGARLDDNQQLQLVDYFAPPNANWMRARDLDMNVTPMAFDYRGRKFLVGTSKECRVWLLDREALGGEDHRTTPPHHAAAVQRRSGLRCQGRLGRHGRLAGFARRAVGARSVLGTRQPHLPRADRVWPAEDGRGRGLQAGGNQPGPMAAESRVALA